MRATKEEANGHPSKSKIELEDWVKYYVKVYRGKSEGGIKTVKFKEENNALAFGQRQEKRRFAVAVFNCDGKQIYHTTARSV